MRLFFADVRPVPEDAVGVDEVAEALAAGLEVTDEGLLDVDQRAGGVLFIGGPGGVVGSVISEADAFALHRELTAWVEARKSGCS